MSIKRTALCSSAIAFALAAQAASAQTPLPKVRPLYYPRGEAANDSIFTRMINYNMYYSATAWHQQEWPGPGSPCECPPPAYIHPRNPLFDPLEPCGPENQRYLSSGFNYDPEDVAARIGLEAIWRGQTRTEFDTTPNDDVAIAIVRFAEPVTPELEATPGRMPDLYNHGDDWIQVIRTGLEGHPVHYFRTVWMSHGIAETRCWMRHFVDDYEDYSTTCDSTVYRPAIPSRFVFDQEPEPLLMRGPVGMLDDSVFVPFASNDAVKDMSWQDVLDYWCALKNDGRFGTGTESGEDAGTPMWGEPVPGCGGKTLWRLWWEARQAGVENPCAQNDTYQYDYKAGSERNQKWYTWFFSINHQANIGAMDEAAYQVISAKWPGCMSSDYENSMRTSAYLFRGSDGALGPTGIAYPIETQFGYNRSDPESSTLTASPMEAGVLNALHFYSDVASYHWLKWREDSPYPIHATYPDPLERWGNTGGVNEYTYGLKGDGRQSPLLGTSGNHASNGDEFWEATSLRVNNFELSNCFKMNLPSGDYDAAEGMTAWITLPHQPAAYFGLEDDQEYNGLTYNHFAHIPMRHSAYGLYRTVADCRMRGVNEFMVWNDTGRDADGPWDFETYPAGPWGASEGNYAYGGLHADRAANWNILKQVMHQVYAYDCTVQDIRGSYATAMSYSSGSPHFVERLRYADQGDADTDAHRAVKVDPAGSGSSNTARIQLKFTPNGTIDTTGDCINFEIRLKTDIAASVKVEVLEIQDESTSWIRLGSGQSETIASDLDGKHFYLWDIPTGTDFRTIRFRLPRTSTPSSYSLIDSTANEVNIRVTGLLAGESSPSITIDNAICYISDTHYRDCEGNLIPQKFNHPADLNADGVVDSKDNDTFDRLSSYVGDAEHAPIYRYFIDFDGDGDPSNDETIWDVFIFSLDSTWSLDAHRYSMIDLDMISSSGDSPSAVCIADIGKAGGLVGQDGALDNNDFIVFITLFFNADSGADMGMAGGLPGSDGFFDNNDFIAFINWYFQGCTS